MTDMKHGQTREEQPFPYPGTSQSGTTDGYMVEARNVYPRPLVFHNQVFDNRWRTVCFQNSPIGVPVEGNLMDRPAAILGYMPYQAAQALRWWLLAELNRGLTGGICLETRIVRYEVKYSLSSTAISAHDNLGGDLAQFSADRPIDMQGKGRPQKEEHAGK